jgi:hypothetical protein
MLKMKQDSLGVFGGSGKPHQSRIMQQTARTGGWRPAIMNCIDFAFPAVSSALARRLCDHRLVFPAGGIARSPPDQPHAPVPHSLFYLVEIRHRQPLERRSGIRSTAPMLEI